MRKVTAVLTAAVLSVGFVGVREAFADKPGPVSFRPASATPVRGYEKATIGDKETVYIAPQSILSVGEIPFAEIRQGSTVEILDIMARLFW